MDEINALLDELKQNWSSSDHPIKDKVMKLKSFVKHVKEDPSSPLMDDEIDELLNSISSADFTEKRLRLELANEFHRPNPIVDAIKMEESHLVRRALSFQWIYEDGKSDMTDPELLLRSILPIVAYTTRFRIVKLLSRNLKNEELCQQIFLAVGESYGTSCATEMLHSCPADFIRERLIDHFNNNRLMPSDQVLRRIAMKDPQIALDYLKAVFCEIRDKLYGQEKLIQKRLGCNLTLKYLWLNSPKEVWQLYEMFDTQMLPPMTWQSAKKLLKTDRRLIVNAKKFSELIPPRRKPLVAKYLCSTFPQFFSALFPEEMENFPSEIHNLFKWLSSIPRIKKFTILNTAFRENYRCDILGVPEFISPEIMEILPLGHREQISQMKIDMGDVSKFGDPDCEESKRYMEAYWYSFMGIKKSVPKLRKILFEEIEMKIQSEIAELLVYTCYINDRDLDSLAAIAKLIACKWIHGHTQLRERFLKAIEEKFGFRKLNKDAVWEALEDFVKLAQSNYEFISKPLLEGLIEYHLKTHQPIDHLLIIMTSTKLYTQKYGPPDWDFLKHDPDLHKQFLRQATDQICTRYPWEECHLIHDPENQWIQMGIVTLCETFTKWNQRNRKQAKQDRLSVTEFPWLVCRLREIMTATYGDDNVQMQYRIINALKTDPEILQGYFKEYVEACPLAPVLEYFLRTDPKEIRYNISSIIPFILRLEESLFKTYRSLFVQIKIQGFPHFQASIVETCLEIAQDDTATWNERRNATLVLTYLWDAKSYLNTVSLFYPTDDTEELLGETTHMDFRYRTAVIESLSQLSISSQYVTDAFTCMLKFCVIEDYLNATVGPLTSLCLRAPLREAVKFLKEDLLDRDISIKKHSIRLICHISDKTEDFQELLAYLWENETHHTIKETVLIQMFEFLGERPTAENWGFLKGALNSLNGEDKELLLQFYTMSNVVHVPAEFLPDYFLTCLEKFPESNKAGRTSEIDFKAGVLGIAPRFINYLPIDFIDHLLHQYLFEIKEQEIVQVRAIDLAVAYCLRLNSKLVTEGDIIKTSIAKLSQPEKWNFSKQNKRMVEVWTRAPSTHYPARQALHTFIATLCYESYKKLAIQGEPVLITQEAKAMYKFLAEIIEQHFNKQDIFTVWFYLKCVRIFCPIQFHYSTNEGKMRTKDNREEGFRQLNEAGMRFQKLVDDQIKNYGPFVLGFMSEKLVSFFTEICQQKDPLFQKERVIFFIDGLLRPAGGDNGLKNTISQANQILAIELMPSSSPQCMYYRKKYADCQDTVTKLCGRTTRIFLCDRYSTRF